MINPGRNKLSTSFSELNLTLMRLTDEQHMRTPYYGARQMARHWRREGYVVGRKRIRRLMQKMGLWVIHQRPCTTIPVTDHEVHPYESVYLHAFENRTEARNGIGSWMEFYGASARIRRSPG
jgi:hypothetical protein